MLRLISAKGDVDSVNKATPFRWSWLASASCGNFAFCPSCEIYRLLTVQASLYLYHTDPCLSTSNSTLLPSICYHNWSRSEIPNWVKSLHELTHDMPKTKRRAVHFFQADATALVAAAEGGQLEIVELLLKAWRGHVCHVDPQNRWCSRPRPGPMWIMLLGVSCYIFIWVSIWPLCVFQWNIVRCMVIREFVVEIWREFIHVMLGYPHHLKKFITQNRRGH